MFLKHSETLSDLFVPLLLVNVSPSHIAMHQGGDGGHILLLLPSWSWAEEKCFRRFPLSLVSFLLGNKAIELRAQPLPPCSPFEDENFRDFLLFQWY